MMAKPCAKAIAAIPSRPIPWPTTAAAPAPMNTNEKVPMNSAMSLGPLGRSLFPQEQCIGLGWPAAREERPPAGKRAALLRGDHLGGEIDAQRLRDADAVFGI